MRLISSLQAGEPDGEVGVDYFKFAPGEGLITRHHWQVFAVAPLRCDYHARFQVNKVANPEVADGNANIELDGELGYRAVDVYTGILRLIGLRVHQCGNRSSLLMLKGSEGRVRRER